MTYALRMELNTFETGSPPGISWAAATWTAPTVPTFVFWTGLALESMTAAALAWSFVGLLLLLAGSPRWRGVGVGLVTSGLLTTLVAATLWQGL